MKTETSCLLKINIDVALLVLILKHMPSMFELYNMNVHFTSKYFQRSFFSHYH